MNEQFRDGMILCVRPMQAAKKKIASFMATSATQSERMDACRECESFRAATKQCEKCGCFMEAKTWIKDAKCPAGKW
jgi:hypothetical protein